MMTSDVLERLAAARPEIADRSSDVLNDRERADLLATIVSSSQSQQVTRIGIPVGAETAHRPPGIGVRVLTVVGCVVLLAALLGLGAFQLDRGKTVTSGTHAGTAVPATEGAVPNVVGQMLPPALSALSEAGFKCRFRSVTSSQLNGTVVSQSPIPGTETGRGTTVVLDVAGGNAVPSAGTITIPNVVGEPLGQAYAILAAVDLEPTTPVPTGGTSPPGDVTKQTPDAGSKVAPHTTVTLDATSY
jgi:hypothetical protein